jgi:hypothetical protein
MQQLELKFEPDIDSEDNIYPVERIGTIQMYGVNPNSTDRPVNLTLIIKNPDLNFLANRWKYNTNI